MYLTRVNFCFFSHKNGQYTLFDIRLILDGFFFLQFIGINQPN